MALYPPIEPHTHGMIDVGDGDVLYWEICGNPTGKPALMLHGGPGSGCTPWHRRLFDPAVYRIVLFDQRGCGRSTPHASAMSTSLTANDTPHTLTDIERLREHLGIERWLVLGGSWGCTLALAYAEQHPERVTELITFGVTTGRREEFDWLFRGGVARFFPEQWEQLLASLPAGERSGNIIAVFNRRLNDDDLAVRRTAATAWCLWESATPAWPPAPGLSPRFMDDDFALAFARIVVHYVRHDGWIGDARLLREAGALAATPGVIINGRFDFQSPISNAWTLHRAWPKADLVIVENAGHAASDGSITAELLRTTDRFRAAP